MTIKSSLLPLPERTGRAIFPDGKILALLVGTSHGSLRGHDRGDRMARDERASFFQDLGVLQDIFGRPALEDVVAELEKRHRER